MLKEDVQRDTSYYLQEYLAAVDGLPIESIFFDPSRHTVYTIYRGDLQSIADRLFGAEANLIRKNPNRSFQFEVLDTQTAAIALLPTQSFVQLYPSL